ncbi:MAG: hypothetical protein QHH09_04520 [Microgenomates group bacterium]|nr:hypothetical protein [Microgenomates group bacterium]
MKEIKKHLLDYLILFTCGVFFLFFLRIYQGEKFFSFIILLIFVSFYILWGVYHHALNKTLHLKNLIEYVFIGFAILLLIKALIINF